MLLTENLASKHAVGSLTDNLHASRVDVDGRPLLIIDGPVALHREHELMVDIVGQQWELAGQLAADDIEMAVVRELLGAHDVLEGDALTTHGLVVNAVIRDVEEFHNLVGRNDDERVTAELRQNEELVVLGELPIVCENLPWILLLRRMQTFS